MPFKKSQQSILLHSQLSFVVTIVGDEKPLTHAAVIPIDVSCPKQEFSFVLHLR